MKNIKKVAAYIFKKDLIVYLFLILLIIFHGYLISRTFFFDEAGNIKGARAGYGDIPFHMTQIAKFGFGNFFDLNEPIFTGTKIHYAFLVNFISGIFLRLTDSWIFSMHFVSIFLMTSSIILIFLSYKIWLQRGWAALLALFLFLLGSGLGAWEYIRDILIPSHFAWNEFMNFLIDNHVSTVSDWRPQYPEQPINWGGSMSLVFLHQRAFFLGVFLFAVVIYLLSRFPKVDSRMAFWLIAIAIGLGPLSHYHTFVILCLILVAYLITTLIRKNYEVSKKIFFCGLIAAMIALPQIIYLTEDINPINSDIGKPFVHYRFGWMTEPGIGSVKYPADFEIGRFLKFIIYTKFLWINFGFILPLLILAGFTKDLLKPKNGLPYLWIAILIFMLNNLIQFQPWDYDNNKLLVYFMFFGGGAIAYLLLKIYERNRYLGIPVIAISVLLLTFSGIVDVLPRALIEEEKMPVIFSKDGVSMSEFVKNNLDKSDLIITSSTHLNVVSSLAGRPTLVGYPGWLWTKGVDYGKREKEIKDFFINPNVNKGLMEKYGADYALLDSMVLYDWNAKVELFNEEFDKIYTSNDYYLYKLR